MINMFLSSS